MNPSGTAHTGRAWNILPADLKTENGNLAFLRREFL
jgi:hypothetical protein